MRTHRIVISLLIGCVVLWAVPQCFGETRREVDLSGNGWKLWLDADAAWKDDELFLPPVDLSKLKVNAPTGGWQTLEGAAAKEVSVPGTAEEYLQSVPGPEGDITGVTWWYRSIQIPNVSSSQRVLLRIEAARQRAEIYVNQKLVGYDMIGNTPIEADLSNVVQPGQTAQLAVRITDPGGNFDWHDKGLVNWGSNRILLGHGFGGITGRVKLIVCNPVYVDDLYIQNTPAITDINANLTVRNTSDSEVRRDVTVRVLEKGNPSSQLVMQQMKDVRLAPGSNTITVKISAPQARLWDTSNPNLYVCEASLDSGGQVTDAARETFGFRWFEAVGVGKDAMFRLNGKRIVLRSAISWGFWPINGLYATAEMAEKQIRAAREMGLNMLNFHRCLGQPIILEKADELGLLYYEEPGNIASGMVSNNPIARGMAREKYLRMVKRDRSHPSMIIYCMTNETDAAGNVLEMYTEDMKLAHAIDPSRILTRSSGLRCTPGIDVEMSTKMHMFPFDDRVYMSGWYDDHSAGGPETWNQTLYRSPRDYYHRIQDSPEIVFWGEEGAISTPPRLGLIKQQLDASPNMGWDGRMYLDWYKKFDDFLTAGNLRDAFPTVDSLCAAMGNISMEHQGRKTQVIRINNDTDAYCINGWEAEALENHSGIVDCFRNPKGDPSIIAYYSQPLYVAVMVRSQIVPLPGKVVVDFHVINEKDLKGPHKLIVGVIEPSGRRVFEKEIDVTLAGGDVYGQLLTEGIEIPLAQTATGRVRIDARLVDSGGRTVATGRDDILGVNWRSDQLAGKGAVMDSGGQLRPFLEKQKGLRVADYADGLDRLDWVVATRAPSAAAPSLVPTTQLRDPSGQKPGLLATFFSDPNFTSKAADHQDETVDLYVNEGATPDPAVATLANYSVRWEGQLLPPATGSYSFQIQGTGTATLTINGEQVSTSALGARGARGRGAAAGRSTLQLEAGKPVNIKVEWRQGVGEGQCRLLWLAPASTLPDPQKLIDRVKQDGTTLILLDNAADWMDLITKNAPSIKYNGSFIVGRTWAGGVHFVRSHPLFKDLPVNDGMNWPYQAVVRNGNSRSGLLLDGAELVAGAFHANTPLANPPVPIQLGTAVGIIPCGKGRIIVSTLDITGNLNAPEGPADVARKLLCNFIGYAMKN